MRIEITYQSPEDPGSPTDRVQDCIDKDYMAVAEAARRAFSELVPAVPSPVVQPPGGETLVNFKTIFYSQVGVQESTAELVGHKVVLRVIPQRFIWDFGDGTTLTTSFPGRPHPVGDVNHSYKKSGAVTVGVRVTFSGEFSVDGGEFQVIEGTIYRDSPSVDLVIRKARGELVRPK